jgi:hypothetical protein
MYEKLTSTVPAQQSRNCVQMRKADVPEFLRSQQLLAVAALPRPSHQQSRATASGGMEIAAQL